MRVRDGWQEEGGGGGRGIGGRERWGPVWRGGLWRRRAWGLGTVASRRGEREQGQGKREKLTAILSWGLMHDAHDFYMLYSISTFG